MSNNRIVLTLRPEAKARLAQRQQVIKELNKTNRSGRPKYNVKQLRLMAKDLRQRGKVQQGVSRLNRDALVRLISEHARVRRVNPFINLQAEAVFEPEPPKERSKIAIKEVITRRPSDKRYPGMTSKLMEKVFIFNENINLSSSDEDGMLTQEGENNNRRIARFIYQQVQKYIGVYDTIRIIGSAYDTEKPTDNKARIFYHSLLKGWYEPSEITEQLIYNSLDNWSHEVISDDYTTWMSGFTILGAKDLHVLGGGCNLGKRELKPVVNGFHCIDPKSSNNNCAIRCILKYLSINKIITMKITADKCRREMGLELNTPIHIDQMDILAIYFKVNIKVHNFKRECIKSTEYDFVHTVDLLLTFCKEMMIEGSKCPPVGHYVLIDDIDYSEVKCKFCGKLLPKSSVKRNAHKCSMNMLAYNQYQKTDKTFLHSKNKSRKYSYAKSVNHIVDFETFIVGGNGGRSNVYASGWYNKNVGYKMAWGKNALDDFIDYLVNVQPIVENTKEGEEPKLKPQFCIAYNGSGFDFHFILQALLNKNVEVDSLIISNGSILSLRIIHNNMRFWDINRHIQGSLKNSLKSFNCKTLKGDFEHYKIKSWEDVATYKSEWEPYLKSDVMGLKELVDKYVDTIFNCMSEVDGLNHITTDPRDFLTSPSQAYQIWLNTLFNNKDKVGKSFTVEIPCSDKLLSNIRSATYGGRTYPLVRKYESKQWKQLEGLFNEQQQTRAQIKELHEDSEAYMKAKTRLQRQEALGKQMYDQVNDYIFNADVTSLYPTAMRYFEYPTGEAIEMEQDKLEQFKYLLNSKSELPNLCLIKVVMRNTNRNLVVTPIPRPKYECNKNGDKRRVGVSWDIEDITEEWYTNIDIEHAIKHGYEVVQILDGWYWEGKANMFSKFIDVFFQIKGKQDELKGTSEYNGSLRFCAKLFMNSLYGKLLQRPIYSTTKVCQNSKDVYEFWNKHDVTEVLLDGDYIILSGDKITDGDKGLVNTKPSHLGAFLLSYSRRIMLNAMEAINPKLDTHLFSYGDTDSIHILNEHLKTIQDKVNPYNGKKWLDVGLGCLSNDIDDGGKILYERSFGPKNYFYIYINNKGEIKDTRKCKGIVKTSLVDDIYTDECDEMVCEMPKRLKKVGIKPNGKQREAGFGRFDIVQLDMSRTWRSTWQMDRVKEEDMNVGRRVYSDFYYPKGHKVFNS